MGFAMVPFKSLKALQTVKFNWVRAAEYLQKTDAKFFYLVSREAVHPEAKLHARMIFYNGEDPATGSAAGCCVSWAVMHGVFQPEQLSLIEQGIEMLRPSYIYVRASKVANAVNNVRVGGGVVETMRAEVYLD